MSKNWQRQPVIKRDRSSDITCTYMGRRTRDLDHLKPKTQRSWWRRFFAGGHRGWR